MGRNNLLILLLLFALYNLIFINKAFHIDDIHTIEVARAINIDPVKVSSTTFYDNPILLQYYYAPIIKVFGEKEPWLHLFYLPFPLLTIISFYYLSLRFAGGSFLPALFLTVTPAFLVISQSIMLDIPMLGFFLASLALFIRGSDEDDSGLLILSGILAGVSCLIKYSGLMLLPIFITYSLVNSRKRHIIFLIVPIFIFFLWGIHNFVFYGSSKFLSTLIWIAAEFSPHNILARLVASLSFISGTSVIAVLLTPYLCRTRAEVVLFSASLFSGAMLLASSFFGGYSAGERYILVFLLAISIYLIISFLKIGASSLFSADRDGLFLSLWFFIVLSCAVLFSHFISARAILILLPPTILLIYRKITAGAARNIDTGKKSFFLPATVTFLFSAILCIGDYSFAGIYRDFSQSVKSALPAMNDKVYCSGSWAFRYYMQKEGVPIIYSYGGSEWNLDGKKVSEDSLEPHVFIAPITAFPWSREHYASYLKKYKVFLIEEIDYNGTIVLLNKKAHAGFYCQGWGLMPFYLSFKKVPVESFMIFKIDRLD